MDQSDQDEVTLAQEQKFITDIPVTTACKYFHRVEYSSDMAISPFIGPTLGPAIPVSCDPLELFSAFFDDTLIGLIVTETNKYAKLCLESEGKQSTWSSTEVEIRAYLGFHILMGLNHKPEIRDYWILGSRYPFSSI